MMKSLMIATASLMLTTSAIAEVKMGIELGFTGPIESLTPDMAASAELAIQEANDSGLFLGGESITALRADSTCADSAAATAAAERLAADGVAAIVGADCSGVTGAVVANVSSVQGIPTISPSATSPTLSTIDDNGFFFRTAPSDAQQGAVIAAYMIEKGMKDVAVAYFNNDYGKGLNDVFVSEFKAMGGTVALSAAHEGDKADYSAEVAALAASGASNLVVFSYLDQGGNNIVKGAIEQDAFSNYVFGDGMKGQSIIDDLGSDLDGTLVFAPGGMTAGGEGFAALAGKAGINANGPYTGTSYDAAALLILAAQAAGSADRSAIAENVMSVANAPGEVVLAGELAKGLTLLSEGKEINYQGATDIELVGEGEAAGGYEISEIRDGAMSVVEYR